MKKCIAVILLAALLTGCGYREMEDSVRSKVSGENQGEQQLPEEETNVIKEGVNVFGLGECALSANKLMDTEYTLTDVAVTKSLESIGIDKAECCDSEIKREQYFEDSGWKTVAYIDENGNVIDTEYSQEKTYVLAVKIHEKRIAIHDSYKEDTEYMQMFFSSEDEFLKPDGSSGVFGEPIYFDKHGEGKDYYQVPLLKEGEETDYIVAALVTESELQGNIYVTTDTGVLDEKEKWVQLRVSPSDFDLNCTTWACEGKNES